MLVDSYRQVLREAVGLLLELGAEVEEDCLYVSVVFRHGGEEYGLRFTKRLFDVGLGAREDGGLCYALRPGRSFVYATVLPTPLFSGAEANLEKNVFPRAFWDRFCWMVRKLRKAIFSRGLADVDVAWRLLVETRKAHKSRPRRETLLLQRMLWDFISQEAARRKTEAKERNTARRAAYEKLLRLAAQTPHSLNALREKYPEVRVEKIAPDYWRVSAVAGGEEFSGWGASPVSAAAEALLRIENEERRKKWLSAAC